jgi:serine/threonine protein kinase
LDTESGRILGPTKKADLWSIGCIAYQLLLQRVAFSNAIDVLEYQMQPNRKKFDFSFKPGILSGEQIKGISRGILQMLEVQPQERREASQIFLDVRMSMFSDNSKINDGRAPRYSITDHLGMISEQKGMISMSPNLDARVGLV